MDQKQKEELRFLLKARKRADKVLAKRHEAEQEKRQHQIRKDANHELMKQYTHELASLAQKSGILAMAEQAAIDCGGCLSQKVSYYLYYGLSTNSLQNTKEIAGQGELRASHLAIRISWGQPGAMNEAEIRVYTNGLISFHNCIVPVIPIIWRHFPQLLQEMVSSAIEHPRPITEPLQTKL